MLNTWDCFHDATLELVRSTPIKQRLICAYRRHLSSLPADQLPVEVRESFSEVVRCLCGVQPLRGEDAVAASVRKMSSHEADDCATRIVEIFGLMSRQQGAGMRGSASVVQLHSVEDTRAAYEEAG